MNDFIKFSKTLDNVLVNMDKNIEKWANRVIDHLYKEVYKMTPMDTSNLREALVKSKWNGKYAELYFDGDFDDINGTKVKLYVYYQHESLYGMPGVEYTTPGTGAKFVEIPFETNKGMYNKWFNQMVGGGIKWT